MVTRLAHIHLHTPCVIWLLPLHPQITITSHHHLQRPPHCLSGQKMHPTCMYDVCAMSIPIIFDSVGHSVPTVCAKYMQQSALNQFFVFAVTLMHV